MTHILPHPVLATIVQDSWAQLWTTRVGTVPLQHIRVESQVIGKFFQELMTRELHAYDPRWRHPDAPRNKTDPDFVFTDDASHSFELKMSGQPGARVFGNRCSAHGFASPNGKSRDTWLLTINYTGTTLNLIRFGFVQGTDWIGQRASTGNASRLSNDAYAQKLRVVRGDYQRQACACVLRGVSSSCQLTVDDLAARNHPKALAFLDAEFYI